MGIWRAKREGEKKREMKREKKRRRREEEEEEEEKKEEERNGNYFCGVGIPRSSVDPCQGVACPRRGVAER